MHTQNISKQGSRCKYCLWNKEWNDKLEQENVHRAKCGGASLNLGSQPIHWPWVALDLLALLRSSLNMTKWCAFVEGVLFCLKLNRIRLNFSMHLSSRTTEYSCARCTQKNVRSLGAPPVTGFDACLKATREPETACRSHLGQDLIKNRFIKNPFQQGDLTNG